MKAYSADIYLLEWIRLMSYNRTSYHLPILILISFFLFMYPQTTYAQNPPPPGLPVLAAEVRDYWDPSVPLEDILQRLDSIIERDPTYWAVYAWRGLTYATMGDYDSAEQDLLLAIERQPDWSKGYSFYAHLQLRLENYDDADQALSTAQRLDEEDGLPHYFRGTMYASQGLYLEAVPFYELAIALDQNKPSVFSTQISTYFSALGNALRLNGDFADAIEPMRTAIRLNPNHYIAMARLGEVYRQLGDYTNAIEYLNSSLLISPEYSFALGTRGDVHYRLGDTANAIRDLEAALAINPNSAFASDLLSSITSTASGNRNPSGAASNALVVGSQITANDVDSHMDGTTEFVLSIASGTQVTLSLELCHGLVEAYVIAPDGTRVANAGFITPIDSFGFCFDDSATFDIIQTGQYTLYISWRGTQQEVPGSGSSSCPWGTSDECYAASVRYSYSPAFFILEIGS